MTVTVSRIFLALPTLLLVALAAPSSATAQQRNAEILTNESVVQMVTAKVPKNLILSKIKSTTTAFDVTPHGLVGLYTSKTPNDVIKLMMEAAGKSDKEVLTNDDVVFMVTSKLPKDLILLKIQSTKADFDVSAGALVNLNQNKVPQDVMKAMMEPPPERPATPSASATPPTTRPPLSASGGANGGAAADARPATNAASSQTAPRKLQDGEAAVINTTLTAAEVLAKTKAYFTGKSIASNINPDSRTLLTDWYGERACEPALNRCATRANVRAVSEGGRVVVRVQVLERKREAGAVPKPWASNSKSVGKETSALADLLEAYLAK